MKKFRNVRMFYEDVEKFKGDINMELVKVNDKEIIKNEFKEQRILTIWDIAKLHERKPREVTQNLKYIKDKMILGEDYFLISKDELSESKILIQDFIPNNVKSIPLFTESGYLMLVKTFNDDLSWKIQRILIKSYFKIKELAENNFKVPKTFKEALLLAVEQQEEIERLELKNKQKEQILIEQQPKVNFYNTVTESDDTMDFKQVAKVLNYKNIGRNTLFKILREKGILNSYNEPYQKYVNLGYFKIIESSFIDCFGDVKIRTKTVVFQKGVDYINKLLEKEYNK